MHNRQQNRGFTLIEVLVTVLILSIGLLGLAGLQLTGLRSNQSALLRSQATFLAYDITDRMRANRAGVTAGGYNNITNPTATGGCTTTAGCSSSEMAQTDLAAWNSSLATHLPQGQGTVCIDSTPNDTACDNSGNLYAVKISWTDDRSGNPKTFVTSFQP